MDKSKNLSIPDMHAPIYLAKSKDGKRLVATYKVDDTYYTYEYLAGKFAFLSTVGTLSGVKNFLEKFVDKADHLVEIELL